MRVLVDTPVWSAFLRRAAPNEDVHGTLRELIVKGECVLLGPVRQEILSGVKESKQFERLKTALSAFPDEPIRTSDYEQAAFIFNTCRAHGLQGSNTDFLVCAVSLRLSAPIFTLDRDFERFTELLGIELFEPIPKIPPK